MFVLMTMKQTVDKHHLSCDTLEQGYIDFFKSHPSTPKGTVFIPIPNHRNNIEALVSQLNPAWFIFTGGNNLNPTDWQAEDHLDDLAPRRDEVERYLFQIAREKKIPVIAICRGFQHVNVLLGGGITLFLENHPAKPHYCFYKDQTYLVNSYHSHGIVEEQLAVSLQAVGKSVHDNIVEAYVSIDLEHPILGLQWHPERIDTDIDLFSCLYDEFLQHVVPSKIKQ